MATIVIGDITPKNQYTASANQTVFAYSFPIFAAADIKVYVNSTLKSLSTHYSVSGVQSANGGNVTLGTGASNGDIVTIYRDMAVSRTSDYQANGDLLAETLNDDLDKIVLMTQQVEDQVNNNTLKVDQFDTSVDLTLPLVAARKGTVLGFNATSGAPEAGPTIANVNALSAITANINTVAGVASNVTTVAGIAANTTTVAGVAANVSTVAGIASAVTAVAGDATDIGVVAGKATEIGRLGTSAAVADMAILATNAIVADMAILGTDAIVADMAILGTNDVVADMAILATSDIVTDMNVLATSDNVTKMGVLGTSSNVTAMGLLGNSATVADMALLGTSAVVADLALLATTDVIADMNTLATSDIISDLNTLATSDIVTDMNLLATSANVTAMGLLGNSTTVTNMGLLGTSAAVADMAILATSAIVADLAILATSDIVADMAILATSDIVADMAILATTDIVNDMNVLGTSANVTAMNTLGTSANVTAMSNVSGSIANVNSVASNLSGVNAFAAQYRISSSAPSSSLDEGDLWFDTTNNVMMVYDGSNWVAAYASLSGALPLAGGTMTGNIAHASHLTLDVGGNLILDSDNGFIVFKDGGTAIGHLGAGSGNLEIKSTTSDKDIIFQGNDGGSSIEAMRIDMSLGGKIGIGTSSNFNGTLNVFNGTDFSTASATSVDNIYLISDATSGDGVYGASISFSRVQYPDRRAAAIASVQKGSDEDNVGLAFFTHPSTDASDPIVEAMRINPDGNVGVGNTPQLTNSSQTSLQVGGTANITTGAAASASQEMDIRTNSYFAADGNNKYIVTDEAAMYRQGGGDHSWHTAASGSAGANQTFSEKMRVKANGNVGINTSSPSHTLDVIGDSKATRLIGRGIVESSSGVSGDTWAVMGLNTSNASGSGGAVFGSKHADSNALLVGTHDATFNSFVVKGSGKVGIGTTSPASLLTLKAGSTEETMFLFEDNSATDIGTIGIHPSNGFVIQQKVAGASVHLMTHDGNEDINLDSDGFIQFEAAGAEQMRITSTGLGIGTTTPYGKVTIEHASGINNGLTLSSSSATANGNITGIQFSQGATVSRPRAAIYAIAVSSQSVAGHGADLCFATRGAPDGSTISTSDTKMTILSNGSVLVGTSNQSPAETNGATGTRIGGNGGCQFSASGIVMEINRDNSEGTLMSFRQAGGARGSISVGGSTTSYNTSSDYRLKENVDYTWDATTRLKQLKPARFNWIADDTNTPVDGFIAHEVSSVVPEAINGTKDAMTTQVLYVEGDELPEGKSVGDVKEASVPDYQGIDQSKLVPLLVKTIQELEARITALEA